MRRHIKAIAEAWYEGYGMDQTINAALGAAAKMEQEFQYAKEALARWDANEPSPLKANMDIVRAYFNRKDGE